MSSSPYLAARFSICLRCQHRLAKYQQRLWRGPSLKQSHGHSRYLCHSQSLAGREVQYGKGDVHNYTLQSKPPQDTATPQYSPNRESILKRIDIYDKDDLGTDSLGEPAEALVLRTAETNQDGIFYTRNPDKLNGADEPSSVDEILNRIQAEIGIASASGVAKNLVDLRDAWAAGRNFKTKPPTAEEFGDLVHKIHSGFSTKQLYGYYSAGHKPAPDPYNTELPYSSKAFTRSTWTVGRTEFPGDARFRRRSTRLSAEALVSAEPLTVLTPGKPLRLPKGVLIERILRDCWGIRNRQDEEVPGELDIWFPYEHVSLLMDHSQ